MKPSYRKLRHSDPASYYGVLMDELGRLVWGCSGHDHPSPRDARRCAKRFSRQGVAAEPPKVTRAARSRSRGLPGAPAGAKPRLSRSVIEKLISCAAYEPDQGENAAFGTVVHDAIHTYFRSCLARGEESLLGDVDRIALEAFYRTPRGIDPARVDEVRELLDYFARTHEAGLDRLWLWRGQPALEVEMETDVGWAVFSCRMDRIDRTDGDDVDDPVREVTISDFKTAWSASDHRFQGRFYSQMAFLNIPTLEAVLWEPDAIRLNRERRDSLQQPILYQRGDLDEWWEGVVWGAKQRWELRAAGQARPTGGAACEYCSLRYRCSDATAVAREVPENMDQFEEVFMEFVRLEAARTTRRKAMQVFMKERRPLEVGGFEVGFLVPREPSWKASDPLGIVNLMNSKGMDGAVALFTAIDPKKVPGDVKVEAVESGVARYDDGKPAFKIRKAAGGGEVED